MRFANLTFLLTALATSLAAQTTGGATMSFGVLGVVPTQATSALTTSTGAEFSVAVPFQRTRAIALQIGARTNQLRDSAVVAQSVLELGTELRQRLVGGRTASTSELGFILGVGMARVTSGPRTATNPMAHAGFVVAWPFAEAIGLDLRAAAHTEYRAASFTERAPINGTARTWTLGARIGVSLWLRQTTRARRIPVSALPDVTELPVPLRSYQGQLLALDSTAAKEAAQSRTLASDPDASSGGPLPMPYLRRAPIASDSNAPSPKKGARSRAVAVSVDSQIVLAATPTASPIAPVSLSTATVAPRGQGSDTTWVDLPSIPTETPPAVKDPTPVVVARLAPPRDSVETYQDSTGVYLGIVPTLVDGHVTVNTRERLHALVEGQRAAAVPSSYVLLVSAPASMQGEALLDEALIVRAWLVADGIPSAQIAVRQVTTADHSVGELRIIIHGQATTASAKRGKSRDR